MLNIVFKLLLIHNVLFSQVLTPKNDQQATKKYHIHCKIFVKGDLTEANAVGSVYVKVMVNTKTGEIENVISTSFDSYNGSGYVMCHIDAKADKRGMTLLNVTIGKLGTTEKINYEAKFRLKKLKLVVDSEKTPGNGGIYIYELSETTGKSLQRKSD